MAMEAESYFVQFVIFSKIFFNFHKNNKILSRLLIFLKSFIIITKKNIFPYCIAEDSAGLFAKYLLQPTELLIGDLPWLQYRILYVVSRKIPKREW